MQSGRQSTILITYCPRCGWLLRASWVAQELLSTFWEDIESVSLIPAREGGVFEITIEDKTIWSRAQMGGFPDIAELKRRVRNKVAPDKDLGHIDKAQSGQTANSN